MNLKLKDNSELRLSVGITQLEYIDSTGTQYIDTGIKLNQNSRVVYEFNDLNNSNVSIFGARNAASNAEFGYITGTSDSNGARYGNQQKALAIQHNTKLVLDANKNNWSLNNTQITLLTTTFQSNYNCVLFGFNSGGSVSKAAVRVFSCKIYDNDILVRYLIPCTTDLDTPGMYDIVSQTFFYNQGTGNFIAGPVIGSTSYFAEKITTLYHKNCPNINGYTLLKSTQLAQSSLPAAQKLNRIRVDIGNVSGSYDELMQYSTLGGFNDNYEHQTKPRFVGTWTINDWYLPSQLSAAQAAFDGLTVIGDSNYLINFNDLAVQTLDPNEDNYNPAVAIILQGQNKGITMTNAPSGYGRWFLLKTQAAAITSIGTWFANKTIVIDTNGIISSDTTQNYDFESFDEFKYFTQVTMINFLGFDGCNKLLSIDLSNITNIGSYAFRSCGLNKIVFSENITTIGDNALQVAGRNPEPVDIYMPLLTSIGAAAFQGCNLIKDVISLGSITTIPGNCFCSSSIKSINIPQTVNFLGIWTFRLCSNLERVTFNNLSNITAIPARCFESCYKLKNINISTIAHNITSIGELAFNGIYRPLNDDEIIDISFEHLSTLGPSSFSGVKLFNILSLGSITSIPNNCFAFDYTQKDPLPIPDTVTNIEYLTFYSSTLTLHLLPTTPPTLNNNYNPLSGCTLYVGDGSSAAHDNAILADYVAASGWASYSSRLDTWYNFLYPQTT